MGSFSHFPREGLNNPSFRLLYKLMTRLGIVSIWTMGLLGAIVPYAGVFAEIRVDCYNCVWQNPHSNDNGKEDHCKPENFSGEKVSIISCPQGCITIIMYENDPVGLPVTISKPSDTTGESAASTTNMTEDGGKPPMSFFTRGCPMGDTTRKKTGCEEKSYRGVYREECFCTTPLCNGSNNGRSCRMTTIKSLLIVASFLRVIG